VRPQKILDPRGLRCHHRRVTQGAPSAQPQLRDATSTRPGAAPAYLAVRRVIAAVLLAGWLAWVVVAWATEVRVVSAAQLRQDVARGAVVAAQLVQNVHTESSWAPFGDTDGWDQVSPEAPDGSTGVVQLAYRTTDSVGRVRVVDADGPVPEQVLATARSQRTTPATTVAPPSDLAQRLGIPLAVATLAAIVLGPPPTRGSRWFWVLAGLAGVGLGVVAYAVLEGLAPRRPGAAVAGRPRHRMNGAQGLLAAVVVTVLVDASATGLALLLGPVTVPHL
jgi:hypothetical protein